MKRFYAAEEEEQIYHRSCIKVARHEQQQAECTSFPAASGFHIMSCSLSANGAPFGGHEHYFSPAAVTAACLQAPPAASAQMFADMQGPQQHVVGRFLQRNLAFNYRPAGASA
ncbi:hypothetical protein GOP47_0014362 [Adiantum capillus-veneris]|uniref:Uncharacterized protein n=1 Tax=Adiantum capillus-veneris TaxID=13818 RepID=A0A9D4ULW8_ADICA|nr:hypothetical protein GOP47_0014362 [Adiantum capillus-veneris]